MQLSTSFSFAGTSFGPFLDCNQLFPVPNTVPPTSAVIPFQFGEPLLETVSLTTTANGDDLLTGRMTDNSALFTWQLNSITDSNGKPVLADIEVVPEPGSAGLFVLIGLVGLAPG